MCAAQMTESELEEARNFSWEPALTHENLVLARIQNASPDDGREGG
jgi:hypothetical protein